MKFLCSLEGLVPVQIPADNKNSCFLDFVLVSPELCFCQLLCFICSLRRLQVRRCTRISFFFQVLFRWLVGPPPVLPFSLHSSFMFPFYLFVLHVFPLVLVLMLFFSIVWGSLGSVAGFGPFFPALLP